jgi:predicted dehydrogenase
MKIATIGSGSIVDKFIEAIALTKETSLAAVFSRKESSAKSFAAKHKAPKFYTDLDEMFLDKDIDAVYIASPNNLHFDYAKKALKANKNVIVEKPFTSTLDEALELFELAKKQNLFLFEAITTIHLDNYKIVKENLCKLGNIKIVNLNFSQFSKRYLNYMRGEQVNVFDPKFSGGALVDINVYNIHFTVGLFGKPKSYKYYPNIGYNNIDTSGAMIFTYDNFIAVLIAAKDSNSDYLFFIQGDKGTIKISGASSGVCKNVDLFLQENNFPDGIEKFSGFSMDEGYKSIGINQAQHLSYELKDFAEIIKKNDFDAYEKLKNQTLVVMEILYKSRIEAGIKFAADKKE